MYTDTKTQKDKQKARRHQKNTHVCECERQTCTFPILNKFQFQNFFLKIKKNSFFPYYPYVWLSL